MCFVAGALAGRSRPAGPARVAARGRAPGSAPAGAALAALAALAGLGLAGAQGAAAAPRAPRPAARTGSTAGSYTCDTVGKEMVNGTPDVAAGAVPAIRSVQIAPSLGGLLVVYKFRKGFALAPEGVYFAWTVFIYRHRVDASNPVQTIELQIEDRGLGWEPTGWSVLASTYYNSSPVAGQVRTDAARDALATFFPGGFANLKPPFYWYASQEVFRGYLPRKSKVHHQDFSVNGSIVNDCPSGVRAGTYSLPDPAKLLAAV
jgi:hypothetical protein